MSRDSEDPSWPAEAGDPTDLPREMEPPPEIEERVTATLLDRGLIERDRARPSSSWRPSLRWMQAAAAAAIVAGAGFLAGRVTVPAPAPVPEALQYALLLYENEGFDRAEGPEALDRYREYSAWVAEARRRGQFVDGKDFDADAGWILSPAPGRPAVEPGASLGEDAPLSGVFLITARDPDHALELAETLPHLAHGGRVLVQKVLRTDVPPS